MPLFGVNPNESNYAGGEKHFVDVIKNRSTNDTLIYKNPEEDFNNGSTLVVEPGEQAIFVNEGNIAQIFPSGSYTLNSANYPFISRLRNMLSGGVSSFHCLVYFVRTATSREIKWGTESPIKVYDKALADQFTGLGVETEVRARGSFRVKVSDPGKLLTQLIGGNFELQSQESLNVFFRQQFLGNIVAQLTAELTAWNGPLIQAPAQIMTYAQNLQGTLSPILDEYGLLLLQFTISGLDVVDNDERRAAMELVSKNREAYYASMASGAGAAAYAQGQQQAYQTYGTNFQQAQILQAANEAAANPGGEGGALLGAGIGLSLGAGLGGVLPDVMAQTAQAATHVPDVPPAPRQAMSTGNTAGQDGTADSAVSRMRKLNELHEAGLISDDEFARKRTDIIDGI